MKEKIIIKDVVHKEWTQVRNTLYMQTLCCTQKTWVRLVEKLINEKKIANWEMVLEETQDIHIESCPMGRHSKRSFEKGNCDCVCITGKNGSGKRDNFLWELPNYLEVRNEDRAKNKRR